MNTIIDHNKCKNCNHYHRQAENSNKKIRFEETHFMKISGLQNTVCICNCSVNRELVEFCLVLKNTNIPDSIIYLSFLRPLIVVLIFKLKKLWEFD